MLATTLVALPQTFWRGEEVRFAQALLTFDPAQQQPEVPGYPLYVAIGRLLNFFVHAPFVTLLVLSVIAAVGGAFLIALAATEILGDEWLGAAAAIILYGSPAMLVYVPSPTAEGTGVALIAAALLWGGVFAGAAIGVLPQIAPAAVVLMRRRPWAAAIALAVIFIPFLETIPRSYVRTSWAIVRESSAAANLHGKELALRFIAHPWGPKWLSFPLLVIAAAGFVVILRRARARAAPLLVFAIVQFVFCFALADRSEGVEPVIPALVAIAMFAAAAFSRWPRVAFAAAIVYAIGGFFYTWPFLHLRRSTPSPPARAMRYARQVLPHDAILICDPSMEAWGRLSRFEVHSLADFDRFADRNDAALFMLADGGSQMRGAAEFSWPKTAVCGKVTTEHYRVVSIVPYPPNARYRSIDGVYPFERTAGGLEWRWLAGDATLALPHLGARVLHLRFGLPDDAPIESNTIQAGGTTVTVARGRSVDVAFAAPPALHIHASRTFPSRDGRTLAVQLLALEQR